jgi:hypothetical protein
MSIWRQSQLIIIFIVLIVGGFLLTPGVLIAINFDYQMYFAQTVSKNLELSKEKVHLFREISELTDAVTAMAAKAANAKDASTAADFSTEAATISAKISRLKNESNSIQTEIDEIERQLSKRQAQTENLLLVIPALCLGALGSVVFTFTKFVASPKGTRLFELVEFNKMIASMVIGAMVSVVVFGLFYTKQISIFSPLETTSSIPDPWRTTIVCLVAGAFADRIFDAASNRLNSYLKSETSRRAAQSASSSRRTKTVQSEEMNLKNSDEKAQPGTAG